MNENGRSSQTTTDEKGNYVFASLPAGEKYTITPVSTTMDFEPPSQVINNLSRDEQRAFSAFPRKTPTPPPVLYTISGQIKTATARLPAPVQITLAGGRTIRTTATNPDGHYVFEGLPEGATYLITPIGKGMIFEPRFKIINKLQKDEQANFMAVIRGDSNPYGGPIRDPKLTPVATPTESRPRSGRKPG
jgi:hypothetical protein